MSNAIRTEQRGDVTVVTMDDGKANALSSPFMNALRHTLRNHEDDGAVVLAGRASFFSAGLDIKLLPALSHEDRVEMVKDLGRLLLDVFLFPRPVVAAVTGHALGGGTLLALASDLRLGVEAPVRFGLNEVAIGLPLPTFGVEIARSTVPVQWISEAALHGRVYTPPEALSRGLFESVHAPDALVDAAVARAAGLSKLPRQPYATTKRRFRGAAADVVRSTLDEEIESFLQSFNNG